MKPTQLLQYRQEQQQLHTPAFTRPGELVAWMGAVQAQDYAMAKWALGLRLQHAGDTLIEEALTSAALIRTHVLRPTWHLVAPGDIRWMLRITAPQVHKYIGSGYTKLGLDSKTLLRSNKVLEKILRDDQHLDRQEIAAALEKAKIDTTGLRLNHILIYAELEGLICSGARKGKQITYALLEERVPAAKALAHDEALVTLAIRYYQSHGPATEKDFSWWSGLSLTDARKAIRLLDKQLVTERIADEVYYFTDAEKPARAKKAVYLLPNFDEYVIAYTARDLFTGAGVRELLREGNPLFSNTVLVDGKVAGIWKRTLKGNVADIAIQMAAPIPTTSQKQLEKAMEKYRQFLSS